MLTSSHLFWSVQVRPSASPWWLVGSVAPDLPAVARAASLRARGCPPDQIVARTYHSSPWREVQLAAHSVWTPLLVASSGRPAAKHLAAGWLGHLAVDAGTHHDDAWPLLWPLSRRRWRSPLSYWQAEHHARKLLVAELAALVFAGRYTRRRPLAVLTAVASGLALAGTLDDAMRPLGLTPAPPRPRP